MRLRRLSILLLGLGLALAAVLGYWRAAPRLAGVSPAPGAESVPAASPLELRFTRPMRPESVAGRLTTRPARRGAYAWEGNTLVFTPDEPWPEGETVTVRLAPGARPAGWIAPAMARETAWSFTVSRSLIAYLWPANAPANLYALDPVSGAMFQLTESRFGLLDFSVSADGATIHYSENNASGGSDLKRLERSPANAADWQPVEVLACPQAFCRSPRLSPDGAILAFEREGLPASPFPLFPQVWLLALPGDAETLAGAADHPTRLADWSPQGILSFYDLDQRAFILLDPRTGETQAIPNETGEAGDWSPDGNLFVFPEILFLPAGDAQGTDSTLSGSHLIAFDRQTASSLDLSRDLPVEDASPAFSPQGARLAFARSYLDPGRWTPGRQIWSMRPDGTQASALTDEPAYSHSGFAWSPDGQQLAYLRFNQESLTDPPELWIMNADGSDRIQLLAGGYSPQWIP
jgi:Tol biopolymer transport system component